jgi:methylmalonyl-CoA mutase cobalamin-binding subunit
VADPADPRLKIGFKDRHTNPHKFVLDKYPFSVESRGQERVLSMTILGDIEKAKPLSIAAVERDCGLPKETLRVWERRYGFPKPLRDGNDDRLYPAEQVATLRLLRRLVVAGHRPGQVVGRSDEELSALLMASGTAASLAADPEVEGILNLLRAHDAAGLRNSLNAMLMRVGLGGFASGTGPRLLAAIGDAWSRGELEIHQEHFFTEQFTTVLRSAINATQVAGLPYNGPRVVFGTFPQEPHALGLMMAEAMFALEQCLVISLGVQTPIREIAAAALGHRADIVALSFSSVIPVSQATSGLEELRALLPEAIEIWVGGACPGLRRKAGLYVLKGLSDVKPALSSWGDRKQTPTIEI